MIDATPLRPRTKVGDPDSPRVITVRLPAGVHKLLVDAANRCDTSLNSFCVYAITKTIGDTFEEPTRKGVTE